MRQSIFRNGSAAPIPDNSADWVGAAAKLLIIQGTGDDNVHFQGPQRLLNRLISLDKQARFV